jgi:hypothetical protein
MLNPIFESFLDGFSGGTIFTKATEPGAPTQLFAYCDEEMEEGTVSTPVSAAALAELPESYKWQVMGACSSILHMISEVDGGKYDCKIVEEKKGMLYAHLIFHGPSWPHKHAEPVVKPGIDIDATLWFLLRQLQGLPIANADHLVHELRERMTHSSHVAY